MSSHLQRHLKVSEEQAPALRIAFASSDLKTVNQHFGSCESLVVYGVEPGRHELLQVAHFSVVEGHDQNKLQSRIEVISECFALFCVAVGEAVFRQLLAAGVRAIRVESGTSIAELLTQFETESISPLARRVPKEKSPDRFAELESAGWED
jgi:Uncharacterized conserved protein